MYSSSPTSFPPRLVHVPCSIDHSWSIVLIVIINELIAVATLITIIIIRWPTHGAHAFAEATCGLSDHLSLLGQLVELFHHSLHIGSALA